MNTTNERPTPETDALQAQEWKPNWAAYARRLERERDKATENATNYFARLGEVERERDEARERLNGLSQHFGAGGVVDLAVKLLRLERERDNALSDAKQADTDSIRALAERNEAREQLALERALADRLAGVLELYCADDAIAHHAGIADALAAWKEARND